MALIQLLFFSGLLAFGASYNEVKSCYTKRTTCSSDSGYKEDIKGIRESLENISTTLKLIGELLYVLSLPLGQLSYAHGQIHMYAIIFNVCFDFNSFHQLKTK